MARSAVPAPETALGEFMWMPGGTHTIYCHQGSKDVAATVLVDRSAAAVMQQQLSAVSARGPQKPFCDFDHDDKQASFWPTAFTWRDAPAGVYVAGEWSAAGKSAIEGKTYRAFSPVFHVDDVRGKPARVVCNENAGLNFGGLVNNPAFKEICPIWAKHAGDTSSAASTQQNHPHNMTDQEKAALEANIQQTIKEITELKAKDQSVAEVAEALIGQENDLQLMQAQLAAKIAEDKLALAEREIQGTRTRDAQAEVAAAVKRGAIAAKDTANQASWVTAIVSDATNIERLRKIPGSAALAPRIVPEADVAPRRYSTGTSVLRASNENLLTNMAAICARQSRQNGLAYNQRPQVARELAELYAKEILPRLREGDDIPLMGVNTLGTLAQTLVATRTLELLTKELPILSAIGTDFSDQIVSYGDTLKSRTVGIPTVATFNTTTGWATPAAITTTDVSITYNQFKGVVVQFLGHELAGTVRRLFDELAPAQAWALGDNMTTYVLALITAAGFTSTATSAGIGSFGRSTVIDMGTAMRKRGVPAGSSNRTLLLNSDYFGELGKDAAIVSLATYQKADVITEGVLPSVHGFKVIDAPTLPATAIAGGTLAGFGMSKSALVLATRLSADYVNAIPGAGNGNLTVVTTPAGFSANLVQFVDNVGATATSRLEVIYGASAGQSDAGQILLTP